MLPTKNQTEKKKTKKNKKEEKQIAKRANFFVAFEIYTHTHTHNTLAKSNIYNVT